MELDNQIQLRYLKASYPWGINCDKNYLTTYKTAGELLYTISHKHR